MADDDDVEEDDESDDEGREDGGSKKKLILIAAGVVLLLVVGGGVTALLTGSLLGVGGDTEQEVDTAELLAKPIYYQLPEIMVDLKSGRCRAPFLKLGIQVGVAKPEDVELLQEVEPLIVDKLKIHLRSLERQDLVGREGAEKLRFDIITILNHVARPLTMRHVLFKEFLLQ